MTKTGKILVGIGCGLIILIAIVVVGGYFALNYIEARLNESVKPDEEAGTAYGKTVDQKGCVDEGLRRSRSMTFVDLNKGMSLNSFLESCLKNSKPVQDFCTGVPGFWDVNDTKWLVEQCHKAGMDEKKSGCIFVFQAKHDFCSPPAK